MSWDTPPALHGARKQTFLVIDEVATIYDELLTREAAEEVAEGLRHQGVECWVQPVDAEAD
jgi:hypothetical protein